MKWLQIPQKIVYENFTYSKKFYVHGIAAVNLSKIYFQENKKKTCKPNNRDLNRAWIIVLGLFNNSYFYVPFFFPEPVFAEHFLLVEYHFLYIFLCESVIYDTMVNSKKAASKIKSIPDMSIKLKKPF